jgi:hypothetical protein
VLLAPPVPEKLGSGRRLFRPTIRPFLGPVRPTISVSEPFTSKFRRFERKHVALDLAAPHLKCDIAKPLRERKGRAPAWDSEALGSRPVDST